MGIAQQVAERLEDLTGDYTGPGQSIRANGAEIIPFNRATTFPKPSIGYEVQQQAETLSQQSLIGFPVGAASGLASITVPITVSRIATAFYTLLNIRSGGAVYRRCGVGEAALPGDLTSQDGARWTLAERCPTPEMFGAIGNGDVSHMMADTYALQYGLDYSAAARVPLYGSPAIYMVDGYKGARESWAPGSTAHGGLIVPDGAVLLGAGIGKTIIRNGAQYWRCVLRVRAGSTSIRHLTIDGNRANCIPILHGPTDADTGSVRGEGIIYEGGDTAGLTIDVHDVKIMRTGHYGIGVQNVGVKSALIDSIIFEDIGGDCIDVKWYSIPNYDKNLIISRIISDGCGKYFLGLPGEADNSANNANQAVVDVGGKCIVRDIFAVGLDSHENSYGNCCVRLRAKVSSQHREDARGSTVDGVYVWSSKPDNAGSNTLRRIVGVQVNCPDISVSNVTAINCFYGLRVHDSGDSVPRNVNLTNITAINCRGAANDAMGISISNACRGVSGTNLKSRGCNIGIDIKGRGGSYSGLFVAANDNGLGITDGALLYNNIVGIHYGTTADGDANVSDTTALYTPAASAMFARMTSITAWRGAWLHHVSTANDAAWNSPDANWIGGQIFTKGDESGSPGEQMRVGARSTGVNGSSFDWAVQFTGSAAPQFRVGSATLRYTVPQQYDGTNQLFDLYNSTKNDGGWTGDDVMLGGQRYLTADTSGTPGEVVKVGARATGASGTDFGWSAQVNGTVRLFIRSDMVQLGAMMRYTTDNAFSIGTAAFRATEVYAVNGAIQTSDEREKHWLGGMSDAELRAGRRILAELGHYQWLTSIADKGEDGARWHFGPRAQRVFAILEDEGLDWHRYAWCCHDSWADEAEETEPVTRFIERQQPCTVYEQIGTDDEGEPMYRQVETTEPMMVEEPTGEMRIVRPARAAGDRYGIRPDQLALFLIAVQDARLLALETA